MAKAVGILEVYGLTCAFVAADAACKAADVTLENFDKNKPARRCLRGRMRAGSREIGGDRIDGNRGEPRDPESRIRHAEDVESQRYG